MPIPVLSNDDIAKLRVIFRWFFRTDQKSTVTPLGRFSPGEVLKPYERGGGVGSRSQLVQITATISGAKGYYQGRLQTAGATLAASANLAAAQLGTFATTSDDNKVLVCNLQELDNATSGHALSVTGDPDIFACFEIPGMTSSNAWSSRVVFIHADQYDTDC